VVKELDALKKRSEATKGEGLRVNYYVD